MDLANNSMDIACPSYEIAAYIDGELDAVRQTELERHFNDCAMCAEELNEQKQFLCTLESSLKDGRELTLPDDFAKRITANAESSVAGLRRPRERFNALFICAALGLFALFALGTNATSVFGRLGDIVDQAAAVLGFAGRIAYSFLFGVTVVIRTIAGRFSSPEAVSVLLAAALLVLFIIFSRALLRLRRA